MAANNKISIRWGLTWQANAGNHDLMVKGVRVGSVKIMYGAGYTWTTQDTKDFPAVTAFESDRLFPVFATQDEAKASMTTFVALALNSAGLA